MRTKKECIKEFNKLAKREYSALILSDEKQKKNHEFDVRMIEDVSGFYQKLELIYPTGEKSPWVETVKGKTAITIENYDLELDITLGGTKNKKDRKITMSFGELCDIVTAFSFMEAMYTKKRGLPGKTPVKIKNVKIKETKEIT